MTTTPSDVTTKPAFDMKLRLAGLPSADSPWTYQAEGETCWAFKAGGEADCAFAAFYGLFALAVAACVLLALTTWREIGRLFGL